MDKLKQLEFLVSVLALLENVAAPPKGIHAVFAQRRQLPLRVRVRLWIDLLKHDYGQAAFRTSLACGPQ